MLTADWTQERVRREFDAKVNIYLPHVPYILYGRGRMKVSIFLSHTGR